MGETTNRANPADLTARWWLTAAVVATLVTFALGLGYVLEEGIFAPLSDMGAVAFAVTLVPVALHIHRRFGRSASSTAVVGVAVFGLSLLAASGAALAVLDVLEVRPTIPVLEAQHLGIGLQGVWMMGVGHLGMRLGAMRRRTAIASLVGGFGYAAGAPVSLWMGFETPLFYAAFLVALGGFMAWALWLRNDLLHVPAREVASAVARVPQS